MQTFSFFQSTIFSILRLFHLPVCLFHMGSKLEKNSHRKTIIFSEHSRLNKVPIFSVKSRRLCGQLQNMLAQDMHILSSYVDTNKCLYVRFL